MSILLLLLLRKRKKSLRSFPLVDFILLVISPQNLPLQIYIYSKNGSLCLWLAMTPKGEVFCCGSNQFGQLGLGDKLSRTSLKRLTFENRDGTAVRSKKNKTENQRSLSFFLCWVFSSSKVIDISGGEHHSAAVSADGVLYAWGRADLGVLGSSTGASASASAAPVRGKTTLSALHHQTDVLRPRVVAELQSTRVVAVSCGARITAAGEKEKEKKSRKKKTISQR